MNQAADTAANADIAADIAVSAGEASGDWIAALVLAAVQEAQPAYRMEGIVGPQLQALGVQALHHIDELSVRGYVEVLRHLPRLLRLRRALVQRWAGSHKPRLLLGVDAPDFNLKLEQAVRQAGVPTVHLACPSIWAWRMQRVHTLRAACNHVLCLFPFEPPLLKRHGVPATYIGHPMARILPALPDVAKARLAVQAVLAPGAALGAGDECLAVMPGSRRSEVQYLGPVFVAAVQLVLQHKPHLQLLTPLPNAALMQQFKAMLPPALQGRWHVVLGHSHLCMEASQAVLLASGTATLEAMMLHKPMVIAYKMPWLSYHYMRGKALCPYVGLPNILLQRFAVPELIQEACTPEALCAAVLNQLDNEANRAVLERDFAAQHAVLNQDSVAIAAACMARYL